MSRRQRAIDDREAQRIVDAAVDCFFECGYAGTTIRSIASAVGVPVARIYDHHTSKHDLLVEIVNAAHDALIAQTLGAVADASEDAAARLEAAVWAQSDFHARHPRLSSVAQNEMRSLAADGRRRILAKRERLHELFVEILSEGAADGCLAVADPVAVARALLAMCGSIPWSYEPAGLPVPRRVTRTYCDLAARMTSGARTDETFVPAAAPVVRTAA